MTTTTNDAARPAGVHRLSAPRLRALAEVLPLLYQETNVTRLPEVFVDVLARLLPGESHGVVIHDHAARQRRWHLRPAAADHEALVPGFFANFHEFTPAAHRHSTGTGEALALSDFVSRARLDRLAIYADYYRRLGLADDLNINVTHGRATLCAAVLRSRRGFRGDERETMNALRPHFRQAWSNAESLARRAPPDHAATPPAPEQSAERLEVRYGLTPRESDVLIWVAQGKTNPEIATILGIRPYTVRTHLERVFLKLGVETRHAAGLRALEVLGLPRA